MADFNEVAPKILVIEGDELTNDPADPGGQTRYGISKRQYPSEDIVDMTPTRALFLFERDYWTPYKLSLLDDQEIADQVFFAFVNMNPEKVSTALQHSILEVRPNSVTPDGVFGDRTRAALNDIAGTNDALQWLNDNFRLQMIELYVAEVRSNPRQIKYLVGWIKRAIA